jgi:hypothetical protein
MIEVFFWIFFMTELICQHVRSWVARWSFDDQMHKKQLSWFWYHNRFGRDSMKLSSLVRRSDCLLKWRRQWRRRKCLWVSKCWYMLHLELSAFSRARAHIAQDFRQIQLKMLLAFRNFWKLCETEKKPETGEAKDCISQEMWPHRHDWAAFDGSKSACIGYDCGNT